MRMRVEFREPRGARDLVQLWLRLPISMLRYRMSKLPHGIGLSLLGDTLRKQAWRAHCAAAAEVSCAEAGRPCMLAGAGRCRADQLFPMYLGGGAPQWRMATLFVQWLPQARELRVVAVGETACAEIAWVAHCLADRHGLSAPQKTELRRFGDVLLAPAGLWRLALVTPWIVAKQTRNLRSELDERAFGRELCKAMTSRAQKLTALCVAEATSQRLGSHLARYVAEALLPASIQVEQTELRSQPLSLASRGNGGAFTASTWTGEAKLRVDEPALPWLTLLGLCGGGENADKGFGAVELTRP